MNGKQRSKNYTRRDNPTSTQIQLPSAFFTACSYHSQARLLASEKLGAAGWQRPLCCPGSACGVESTRRPTQARAADHRHGQGVVAAAVNAQPSSTATLRRAKGGKLDILNDATCCNTIKRGMAELTRWRRKFRTERELKKSQRSSEGRANGGQDRELSGEKEQNVRAIG